MYIQIGDQAATPLKRTVYYADAGISVECLEEGYAEPDQTHQMELLMALCETEFKGHAEQGADEKLQLLQCISDAVANSLPQMTVNQMQHAMFVKRMVIEGEIALSEYLVKMRNLFPERMESLSDELRDRIDQVLTVGE